MNRLATELRKQTWNESVMLRAETRTPATGWHTKAACRGLDPELFYQRHGYPAAIQTCKTCPVLLDCAAQAWANEIDAVYIYGVYAGVPPLSRQRYYEQHRRQHRQHTSALSATGRHTA
jgi:hypothetical protein